MAYGKWSASKSAKRDFAKKMQEIYSDLKAGIQLDGRGNRKCRKTKAL